MNTLFTIDGAAFVAIGLVVLATPSPQPALTRKVDDVALLPFIHTRRLLASQFIGNGLLALVAGTTITDAISLRLAAGARLATIGIVLAVNVTQLRSGAWNKAPLYFIDTILTAFAIGYGIFLVR